MKRKKSRHQPIKLAGVVAAFGLLASAHAQQVAAPAAPATPKQEPEIEAVVVTAQKREQLLQDVPVSVAVFNSKALGEARIDSGTEITRLVPNLRVSVLGDESRPKFSLRGVSTPEFNLHVISPTGVFFDEVYVGAPFLGGAQVFDLERIEVLRGPQGTLFGKNTTAGAVSFISKRPKFKPNGELTFGSGSNNLYESKGAVELPLVEQRLTARFAFTASHSDGYIENLNPAGRDLSNIDRKAARLTLAYKDPSGLNGSLKLFTIRNNAAAIGPINQGLGPGGLNALGKNPRINPFNGSPLGPLQVVTDRSGVIKVRGNGGYLTVNKNLEQGTLTSITSLVNGSFINLTDVDGTIDPLSHADFNSGIREVSQDLRFSSSLKGPFQFITGLYHQRDDIDIATRFLVFGGPPVFPVISQSFQQARRSNAAYVDASYTINPKLTAYGGVRYTRDKGRLSNFTARPFIPLQADRTYSDGKPTGRIGLSANVAKDVLLFGHYARGYRSSAFNAGAIASVSDLTIARPETLDSFEIGIKSQWFERALTLNVTAFTGRFKDQQFLNIIGLNSQQLVNAGESRIKGAEIEAVLLPAKGLRLGAALGLLDTSYRTLVLNGENLAGKDLIEAPHYTGSLVLDYKVPVGAYGLSFHTDATFVGAQFFLPTNAAVSRVGASKNVTARVALTSPSKKYELALYGKNLTDNDVETGVIIDRPTRTRFSPVPYPRRYGVELTARF